MISNLEFLKWRISLKIKVLQAHNVNGINDNFILVYQKQLEVLV